jgi:hypothetical protein
MPERVVNFLTGADTEPLFPVSLETWDKYEIESDDIIVLEIKRVIDHWGDVVGKVNRTVECKAKFFESLLGWMGTGVIIPTSVIDEYHIKIDHYLEVILHTLRKGGKEIPLYPGKMVEYEIHKTINE